MTSIELCLHCHMCSIRGCHAMKKGSLPAFTLGIPGTLADVRKASLKPSRGRVFSSRPQDELRLLVPGTSVDLELFIALASTNQPTRRGPGASSALRVDMAHATRSTCDEPRASDEFPCSAHVLTVQYHLKRSKKVRTF